MFNVVSANELGIVPNLILGNYYLVLLYCWIILCFSFG